MAPVATDAQAIAAAINDPAVVRWLARVPYPYTAADADFFLKEIAPKELVYMVWRIDSGDLVGTISLKPIDADAGELGYWLARAHWGRGFASEAGRCLLAFAFTQMALREITASVVAANARSARVLRKLGFVETGRSVRPVRHLGRDMPHIDFVRYRSAA